MSRKRIVLSDEEDNYHDAEMDLGETASAKKLTESIYQLKVTDSTSKPHRFQSVRKKLFDGENDSDDERKNGGKRSGTSRTQALSSKKETERAKAFAEINKFRSKGLNAINFDESEEEDFEEDEDESAEEDDIEQFIIDEEDEDDDLEIVHETKRSKKRIDIFSAPKKKAPRKASSNEKYFSRSSMALGKRQTPSASTMKAFTEYRGNQERDDENYASDLDGFIVADGDEDEDQESVGVSEGDAEFGTGTTTAINGEDLSQESDGFEAANLGLTQRTKYPPSKPSKSKSNSNRKSIILSDDDDNNKNHDEESMPHVSKSTQKRRVRRTLFTESDDEELSSNEEEEAEDDDGDDDENDGPLLYWKLNARMDEAEHASEDYDDAAMAGELFSMNQKFTLEQAFALYLQFLGKTLVSPKFRQQVENRTLPRHKLNMYEKAARQVENLICTHRESLLGSSAWQGDFLHELQHRPFYMCPQSGSCSNTSGGLCGDGEQRCAACGRMAKEAFFSVYLYGPSYEGMVIWSQNKWIQSLPTCLFLQPNGSGDKDSSREDDLMSAKNSKNKKMSGKKRSRSNRYISYDDAVEAAKQSTAMAKSDEEEEEDDEEFAGEHHCHKRNKQYSAFQLNNQPSILPSALKTPASVAMGTAAFSMNRKRSRTDSEMRQEDEVSVASNEERASSNKKRRVVILYNSECEDEEEKSMHGSGTYRKTPAKSTTSTQASPSKWWNKALPRALNQEVESKWELSIHCKNRTNLYHTLLHYKFRLILKIRENLQRMHSRNFDHAYSGYALEDLASTYVEGLLAELLDPSKRSKSFVSQETDRLQVLLHTAEKRYGGDKFESGTGDIWGSEILSTNDKISSAFSSTSASSSKTPSSTAMRQLKLIKKDFRSSADNGKMLIMGEPRRPTIQSRLSSWLTPKN